MGIVRIIRKKAVRRGIVKKKIVSSHMEKHGCEQKNFSLSSKQRKGMNVVKWVSTVDKELEKELERRASVTPRAQYRNILIIAGVICILYIIFT